MTYRIKNWDKFQHYKNKHRGARLPWIKLYRNILDDLEWHKLSGDASKMLVMCWLIASDENGELPNTNQLAFRLRKSEKETNALLSTLSHWLYQDASKVLAEGYQDASQEEDKRKRREDEERRSPPAFKRPALEEIQGYCVERQNGVDASKFLNYYDSNGWRVGKNPMKDWKAAVRTWEANSGGKKEDIPKQKVLT